MGGMGMSQDEAWLRAIAEAPADDAPRLAYADWLEERGDAERAEFIRVQCALARLPEDNPARPKLQRREKALLKKHGKAWRDECPGWARDQNAEWDRGFLVEFDCTAGDWLKRAATLVRRFPVYRV